MGSFLGKDTAKKGNFDDQAAKTTSLRYAIL
jgi:hypothetical protein